MFELFNDALVNAVAEMGDLMAKSSVRTNWVFAQVNEYLVETRRQHNGFIIIGNLPLWLRVNADEIKSLPDVFQ